MQFGDWNVLQVERHLRKLDQEVAKFKMELEADNAGITEILEKRVCHDHFVVYMCILFSSCCWLLGFMVKFDVWILMFL